MNEGFVRKTWSYWLEQVFLLVAHLVLLRWMYVVLFSMGEKSTMELTWQFVGLAVYGGGLIMTSAFITRRRYRKELHELNSQERSKKANT